MEVYRRRQSPCKVFMFFKSEAQHFIWDIASFLVGIYFASLLKKQSCMANFRVYLSALKTPLKLVGTEIATPFFICFGISSRSPKYFKSKFAPKLNPTKTIS